MFLLSEKSTKIEDHFGQASLTVYDCKFLDRPIANDLNYRL